MSAVRVRHRPPSKIYPPVFISFSTISAAPYHRVRRTLLQIRSSTSMFSRASRLASARGALFKGHRKRKGTHRGWDIFVIDDSTCLRRHIVRFLRSLLEARSNHRKCLLLTQSGNSPPQHSDYGSASKKR